MKVTIRDIIQLVVFASIGAIILWLLWRAQSTAYLEDCKLRGISLSECSLSQKLLDDFRSSNPFWVIIVCVIFMLSNIFRALRWHQMLEPLGVRPKLFNSFFSIMVAYFTNLGIPRSGELVRSGLLARYEKVPFEKIFGTIIMDRVLDVICLLIVLLLGFVFAYDILWTYIKAQSGSSISGGAVGFILMIIFIVGLVGVAVLYFLLKDEKYADRPIVEKTKSFFTGLLEGIKSIRGVRNIPLFIAYTVGIWLSYYLMTYLMFFAFEPTSHLSMIDGLLAFDFGTLGIVFPSPGGMGTYHAMVVESLKISGVDPTDAFSFAMIIFFTINVFCNIVFGLLGLIFLPIYNSGR